MRESGGEDDLLDGDGVVRIEAKDVYAADGRGILILLADGLTAKIDFDFAGFGGERCLRTIYPLIGVERVQQAGGESAG